MHEDYKQNLEIHKSRVNAINAQENVLDFYEKNKMHCESAYLYFMDYIGNKNQYICRPANINKEDFLDIIKGKVVYVITANKIEEAVLMRALSTYYSLPIPSYCIGNHVYQVIAQDKYTLIHNHTLKIGDEFTRRSINDATKIFQPDYIILLGVCYGIDFSKYELGTVFLSDNIEGFRINFRDKEEDEDTLFEADTEFEEKPNGKLINRISGFFNCYQPENEYFSLDTQKILVKVVIGKLLSSNSLMSSKKVKDAVMLALGARRKKPLGGEMEACGVFKSNYFDDNNFDNWLVVKSICDWGEKKNLLSKDKDENEKIKDSIQAYAMMNTWAVFKTMLDSDLLN